MKVMICQPMRGKTDEEILEEREKWISEFNALEIEVADSMISDIELTTALKETSDKNGHLPTGVNVPLAYLGLSIAKYLSTVDAAFFMHGWEDARGCRIEYAICEEYGVPIMTEDDNCIDLLRRARGIR